MLPFDQYLERIETEQLPRLKNRLAAIERGRHEAEDVSGEWAKQTKETIEILEAILAYEKSRNA